MNNIYVFIFSILPMGIFMAWKGIEGDQGIWFSRTADCNNWDPQQNIAGIGSSIGPSASALKIGASFVMVMA
jgi:hypothetical protein